jgi:hypothetical protein
VKLKGCISIVVSVMWEHVEKCTYEVEVLSCHVGYLEDGTDATGDELSGSGYARGMVVDEDGDFASSGRFEDLGQLSDGLLQNVWWADVDFGDYYHYRDVEG